MRSVLLALLPLVALAADASMPHAPRGVVGRPLEPRHVGTGRWTGIHPRKAKRGEEYGGGHGHNGSTGSTGGRKCKPRPAPETPKVPEAGTEAPKEEPKPETPTTPETTPEGTPDAPKPTEPVTAASSTGEAPPAETSTTEPPKDETPKDEPPKEEGTPEPPAQDGGGGGGGGGETYVAQRSTWYNPIASGQPGACNMPADDESLVVAVRQDFFEHYPGHQQGDPYANPLCGKKILLRYGGKELVVTMVDICAAGCQNYHDLDMTPAVFRHFADPNVGELFKVEWTVLAA